MLSGTSVVGGFPSGILTLSERGANGNAGAISVETGDLVIKEGAILLASTFNQGESGDIQLLTESLELKTGGQIVTNTRSSSDAGEIYLVVTGSAEISGRDTNFNDRTSRAERFVETPIGFSQQESDVITSQGSESGIFANTEAGASGTGGSIRLNTESLQLDNRARISAQSRGTGDAGNIVLIIGDTFTSNNADVVTSAVNASGGNIEITAGDIRSFADSDIRTNSAENGGNIDLMAASIILFDDSDIFASAAQGEGGNITLESAAFFGNADSSEVSVSRETNDNIDNASTIDQTLDNNGRAELNATGATRSGTVSTPDTRFIQNSLSELSEDLVDADTIVASSCVARSDDDGTFIISSSIITAETPEVTGSPYHTGTVRLLPTITALETSAEQIIEQDNWPIGNPIAEPSDIYQLSDGRLLLSQSCAEQ